MKIRLIGLLIIMSLTPLLMALDNHSEDRSLLEVTNITYRKNYGTCHMAYQAGLLPERSWLNILNSSGHAVGDVSLNREAKAEIEQYLVQNSADKSQSKRSMKILTSIDNDAPTRISEIPYIKKKHRDIREDVFARTPIKSRANCRACHKRADKGIYDDDDVVIPK